MPYRKRRYSYGSSIGKPVRRPVNKYSVSVSTQVALAAASTNSVLHTAIVPETISGMYLSGNFNMLTVNGTAFGYCWVAVGIIPEALTQSNLNFANDALIYEPAEFIMGSITAMLPPTSGSVVNVEFKSKAMRKIKAGDRVVCIWGKQDSLSTVDFRGVVTFFAKH